MGLSPYSFEAHEGVSGATDIGIGVVHGMLHAVTGSLWVQIQRERRDGPKWCEALRGGRLRTPPVRLIPDDFCHVCFHPGHSEGPCAAEATEYRDPAMGGNPDGPIVRCGCIEYVDREARNNIPVVLTNVP